MKNIKRRKKIKKLTLILVFALLNISIFPISILAEDRADTSKNEFIIDYQYDGKKLSGVEFDIYKLGNLDKDGNVKIVEDFKKYPEDLTKLKEDEWNDYAELLKEFVKEEKIKPVLMGKTDKDGVCKMDLNDGLYLVVGKKKIKNNFAYNSNPFTLILPSLEVKTETYSWELRAKPKVEERKVEKSSSKGKKPEKRSIELRGEDEKPKKLGIELKEDDEKPKKLGIESKEEDEKPKKLKAEILEEKKEEEHKRKKDFLPQTGQLWWPAYALTGSGSLMLALGFIKNRRKKVD